jgi:Tol biopolymer transport system component
VRADTLVAQRLDRAQPALSGDPVVLAGGVTSARTRSPISVAATGLIAFRMNARSQRQLTWFDRSGGRLGSIGEPDENLAEPSLSPDGRRVAAVRSDEDLWLLDGTRAIRFTFDAGGERIPVWSPDGNRIVFRKTIDLYQKRTNGAGETEPLVVSSLLKVPSSWSRDGRFLMYHSIEQTDADLWVVPSMGDRTPLVFLKTPFREAWGAFSPDGRWVAYQSDESGRPEIYVRPFGLSGAASALRPGSGQAEATGVQWQVSTVGGIRPLWRHDGRELYYLNPAGAMMVAPVTAAGSAFETGAPAQLFPTRIVGGGTETQQGRQYDVAPDGRFLINTELDTADAPITLIQNWKPPAR